VHCEQIFGATNIPIRHPLQEEEIQPMSTSTSPAGTTTWTVDPVHSNAEFRVKHMMISNVRGRFTGITGKLAYDPSDVTKSSIEASVDVTTVDTHDPQRDTHLKSPEFFDAEKFPTMTFRSSKVTRKSSGSISVSGPLSIHGVTRDVEFEIEGPTPPVKDPWGNTRIGVNATTKIDRREFGLNFHAVMEAGGVVVGEEVHITLEFEFVQTA
jgi:polyisoprenoid-binding protein YceI